MKNKYIIFFLINLIYLFLFQNNLKSQAFTYEAEEIKSIQEDKTIVATGGVKISDNLGRTIEGKKLIINDDTKIHYLSGNVFFNDNFKNQIKSKKLIINENLNQYIFSEDVTFENKDNILKARNDFIVYDKDKKIIYSDSKTIINDNQGNTIENSSFKFLINEDKLIANNVLLTDKNKNNYQIEEIYFFVSENKIYGKNVSINNNNFYTKDLMPRSKSKVIIMGEDYSILKKSSYTNCKKSENCQAWLINAEEVKHDKKKERISYKNAKFKFYDIPILYFPKFFHPDPSVKRQSGFLTPSVATENNSNYISVPYFFALSENSDFTFSPRLFNNLENLYQGEYRKLTKRTENILDFSIKNNSPLLLDGNSTDTHFFLNSKIKPNLDYYDDSELNFNLELVSDEKFLKNNNIENEITNSQSNLNSSFAFTANKNDLDFEISAAVYEDLTNNISSDRYEYVFPSYRANKIIDTNYGGLLEISSNGYKKNYQTNINENIVINDLIYSSIDKFNNYGFINSYKFNIKNLNSYANNSRIFKNEKYSTIESLFQFDSRLPFIKNEEKFNKTLNPIFSLKFNPSKNKNISGEDRLIKYDNIFSFNRVSNNNTLEGGTSITLGHEYKIFDKNLNDEIFSFNLAKSFRDDENNDLPNKSSLNKKQSNYVGELNYKFNNFFNLNYDFIADEKISDFKYHKIESKFMINNFVSSFQFLEENDDVIGKESFVSNETKFELNNTNNLIFRTRRNKQLNLTEYYDLIYQYKMDCLTAGIKYNKNYYTDGALKPKENIIFSITIMPFKNTVNLPAIN
ncbi:LPS assembly protein LptD [Candidatus Pelagibacter bacterium]|nr:LPS assembly protein LptD [Candidatus Pelagibacter bacterium]